MSVRGVLSMWTRRSVASSGPDKIRLLLRSSYFGRYLHISESSPQASRGSSPHSLRDSGVSHATHQGAQQSSTESTFAATSNILLSKQGTNSESSSLSSRSNLCFVNSGTFPSYLHLKEQAQLSAPGRHFVSLSYSTLEDESSETPDGPQDGEQGMVAGESENWHTKLSAVLATDPLSSNGTRAVAEPARIPPTHPGQERSPRGISADVSRLTSFSVCQRLHGERDIEVAWRYFTWLEKQEGYKHSVDTYNTMIQCLCGARSFSRVFDLLDVMRAHEFPLTCTTCVKVMKSLARERMYDKALAFFTQVGNYGCKPNVLVYNSYLDVLVKAGHYSLVEPTFTSMAHGGVSPDVYTYNIVINGFRKANQVEKAFRIYEEMKQKGWTPNVVTYNTVLHALGKAARTDEVLELFCEMAEKNIVPSAFTYSTLLHIFRKDPRRKSKMEKPWSRSSRTNREASVSGANVYRNLVRTLCKEQDIASAFRILREMEWQGHTVSLATYNLFVVFLGDAWQTDAVLELFRDMKAKNCVPDALTYRTAVEAACRAQKLDEALLLHKEMVEKGHAVEVATWNMLVDAAAKAGRVDTAFELFSQMQQTCTPDMYTYNILIFTLCNLRKSTDALTCLKKAGVTSDAITSGEQGALELFRQMKGVTAPDAVTYHTLIHALCRSGRVENSQDLLVEMEENGFDPGVLVYNKILNLLGQAGKVDKAWKLFLKMQSNNLPDLITYTTLIKFLAKAGSFGKATKLLQDMERKGLVPNIVTYTTLVDGLAKSKRFVEADTLMKHMAKRGCYPDTYAYNSLIDAYCKAGQVAKAYRIFEESINKGCLPDTYTYTSLINGYFRCGNVNDALDMYYVMKGMGCKPNGVTYNILLEGLRKAGRVDELGKILEEISQLGEVSTGVSAKCLGKALSLAGRNAEKVAVT